MRCTILQLIVALWTSLCVTGLSETVSSRTIRFSEGEWTPADWTPLRLINQDEPRVIEQYPGCIGVTKESFREDDYSRERDNAVLMMDTAITEGQIDLTFRAGEGFNRYSAPGVFLSPVVTNGLIEKTLAVFVGHYAVAVWLFESDHETRRVRYRHMGQIARYTDPNEKHVLRCRYSAKQRSIAVQLDDSDVMVFQWLGHPSLSKIDIDINSKVCIVGCHGECSFYEMTIHEEGTLPFLVREEQ